MDSTGGEAHLVTLTCSPKSGKHWDSSQLPGSKSSAGPCPYKPCPSPGAPLYPSGFSLAGNKTKHLF